MFPLHPKQSGLLYTVMLATDLKLFFSSYVSGGGRTKVVGPAQEPATIYAMRMDACCLTQSFPVPLLLKGCPKFTRYATVNQSDYCVQFISLKKLKCLILKKYNENPSIFSETSLLTGQGSSLYVAAMETLMEYLTQIFDSLTLTISSTMKCNMTYSCTVFVK